MLIESLRSCPLIQEAICNDCEENGFGVNISEDVDKNDLIIIKVDKYYNSLPWQNRIPSPDCLIIIKCKDNTYKIYIVELKDIENSGGFSIKNVRAKFRNCLNDFMSNILRDYFYSEELILSSMYLIFVTDPYRQADALNHDRGGRSTKMDALLALNAGEPFSFDGKRWGIQHAWQNPLVTPC